MFLGGILSKASSLTEAISLEWALWSSDRKPCHMCLTANQGHKIAYAEESNFPKQGMQEALGTAQQM